MAFSFTGFAYLSVFLTMGILVNHLYQFWRQEKTTVSKLFLYFVLFFEIFFFIATVGGLFFAKDPKVLKLVVVSAAFFQGLACATLAYMIFYIKFPRISPWIGFLGILALGLLSTVLNFITSFVPFLEPNAAINWNLQSATANNLRTFIWLITFLPMGMILIQQNKASSTPELRIKALIIFFLLLVGLIVGTLDFFLEKYLNLKAITSDIAMITLSFLTILLMIFTKKSSPRFA